jgi:hypothetical protein
MSGCGAPPNLIGSPALGGMLGFVSDTRDLGSVLTFAQSNPSGPGQGDVAALLRRVADSLDALGEVQVQDITFTSMVTGEEDDLTMRLLPPASTPYLASPVGTRTSARPSAGSDLSVRFRTA